MSRRWFKQPDESFRAYLGRHPVAHLDTDPTGRFLAMQMLHDQRERAAIWNAESRNIAWSLDNVNAICWSTTGDEVFIIRESYNPVPDRPAMIVTPLQRDFAYFLERLSWPTPAPIASSKIKLPRGWPVDVVASPQGGLACVVWNDQCEAGIELFSVTGSEVLQLPNQGYWHKHSNILECPVFSPDGRFIILASGRNAWWSDGEGHEAPSPGGTITVGCVIVGDTNSSQYHTVEVQTYVRRGWIPDDIEDVDNEMLSPASFADNDRFTVTLPTGEIQVFSASLAARITR